MKERLHSCVLLYTEVFFALHALSIFCVNEFLFHREVKHPLMFRIVFKVEMCYLDLAIAALGVALM